MNVERRIKHYSSNDKILLVGEGNFTFAKSLANAFGSAVNITATSLDSQASLMEKYRRLASLVTETLTELQEMGCTIIHGVDAHTMRYHPRLNHKLYDSIVFNFPHAGFDLMDCPFTIQLHKELVRGFFRNAREMLSSQGEVHVTHKTSYQCRQWNIEELGRENGLRLVDQCTFDISEYSGYINVRGSGPNAYRIFPVGSAFTFKFAKA